MITPSPASRSGPSLLNPADLNAPVLVRRLALFLVIGLLLGFAVLVLMPWQQNVRGAGAVVAFSPLERQQDIQTPIKGRIKEWFVQEGSQVKKGDLIATIEDLDPDYLSRLQRQREILLNQVNFNRAKVSAYELRTQDFSSVLAATTDAADAKLDSARAQLELAQRDLDRSEAELQSSRLNYEREAQLRDKGLSSQRTYELATMYLQKDQADLKKTKAKIKSESAGVQQAQADRVKAEFEAKAKSNSALATLAEARASLEKNNAELVKIETDLARQARQEIRAPLAGTILNLSAFSDSVYLKEGDKLATLVPETQERAVELYLIGNDVPLVGPGREVRLQFEGWPALQFSGWPGAAVGTFGGEVVLVDASTSESGKFRVLVKPSQNQISEAVWPDATYLRQGTQVKGWILLDTVPLGYELWRQFNGFPPQFTAPNTDKTDSSDLIKRKVKK